MHELCFPIFTLATGGGAIILAYRRWLMKPKTSQENEPKHKKQVGVVSHFHSPENNTMQGVIEIAQRNGIDVDAIESRLEAEIRDKIEALKAIRNNRKSR